MLGQQVTWCQVCDGELLFTVTEVHRLASADQVVISVRATIPPAERERHAECINTLQRQRSRE